jgi:hypothetical protein
MDALTSVLISCLQNPVVASNEVAVRHHKLCGTFAQHHSSQAWSFLSGDVIQPPVYLCKAKEVEVTSIDIGQVSLAKFFVLLAFPIRFWLFVF